MTISKDGSRVYGECTLKRIAHFDYHPVDWVSNTVYVYIFEDENGEESVWKTSKCLCMQDADEPDGWYYFKVNDRVFVTGKSKGYKEYRGNNQLQLSHCVVNLLEKGLTNYEKQMLTLSEKDEVKRVSYKEYKNKYSECETVVDSFNRDSCGYCSIEIIIRNS